MLYNVWLGLRGVFVSAENINPADSKREDVKQHHLPCGVIQLNHETSEYSPGIYTVAMYRWQYRWLYSSIRTNTEYYGKSKIYDSTSLMQRKKKVHTLKLSKK